MQITIDIQVDTEKIHENAKFCLCVCVIVILWGKERGLVCNPAFSDWPTK
jgi:hypothetical protein